ncbi:MAG: methyltransferase domain-containing protein [Anaerolineales bacterium]|nr:methyltransferase domain-containing protein [Anaerolineales bacterium]
MAIFWKGRAFLARAFRRRNSWAHLAPHWEGLHFALDGLKDLDIRRFVIGLCLFCVEAVSSVEEELLGRETVGCNLCGWKGSRFRVMMNKYGFGFRFDAKCPRCGSLERHRFLAHFLRSIPSQTWESATVLEFSPTLGCEFYRALGVSRYLCVDLQPERADVQMDIRHCALADGACQIVICCHVLEHVKEDSQAMRELWRVMSKDGWGIFQVPIDEDLSSTIEYASPRVEEELHVRQYGLDYRDRLREAGFSFGLFSVSDLPAREAMRLGLDRTERLHVVYKTDAPRIRDLSNDFVFAIHVARDGVLRHG